MNADRIALLYRYLRENTCKGHTVKAEDILAHYANAGYPYEIKALYRDLHKFDDMEGVAIHYDARTKGYWMEQDGFEPYELRLTVDSIQSSKFITQEHARAITAKAMKLTDRHARNTQPHRLCCGTSPQHEREHCWSAFRAGKDVITKNLLISAFSARRTR